jgi:glutamate decarboxylase
MIAPFLQPELDWDFRLTRVHSINTSGHKFGLVYPGIGWVVWRDRSLLPDDLVFSVSYLGGDMPSLGLNFSRPGAQVLLQYYNFLSLGRSGYRAVHHASRAVAMHLSATIGAMAPFELISDGSEIPVFAWRLRAGHTDMWSLYDLSDRLRMRGWLVPAYPLPDNLADRTVQRVVVRNGLGMDLAEKLLDDIRTEVDFLDSMAAPLPDTPCHPGFHH